MKRVFVFAAVAILAVSCTDSKRADSTSANGNAAKQASVQKPSYLKIPGLMPVDVYQNMESKGFTTTKSFTNEGNLWTSKYGDIGINYSVGAFSHDASSVESVQATAMVTDVTNKDIAATLPFFVFLTSLPFDGSDPAKTAAWIKENFNNDKSNETIAGVRFTIYAPSKFARTLVIEPVQ